MANYKTVINYLEDNDLLHGANILDKLQNNTMDKEELKEVLTALLVFGYKIVLADGYEEKESAIEIMEEYLR